MQFINEIEGLVSSQLHVIKHFLSMTKLEARLAVLSIYPLLINLCMLFVCLISLWLTSNVILGYALMQVLDSLIIAMACVLIFNTLLFGLLLTYLRFNLRKMSFEKTRAYLSRSTEPSTHEFKKAGDDSNNPPGQKIMEPTEAS